MLPLLLAAVLWQAPAPLRVPNGETRTVEVPAVMLPARLVFRVRADYWRPAGSNPLLRLRVNGQAVGFMRDRLTPRLTGERVPVDVSQFEYGRWRVRQGPGPGDELSIDLTDLMSPLVATVITFENGPPGPLGPMPLVIEDLRLEPGGLPGIAFDPPVWRKPRHVLPRAPEFEIRADRDRIVLDWEVEHVEIATVAVGAGFERTREVARYADRIEVRDTIVNTTDRYVAPILRHAFPAANPWAHLGGQTDPNVNFAYSPWNPTVFAPIGTAGLGLVAEDDLFRQQVVVSVQPDRTLGIHTGNLCLPPGERRTLVWSIYPIRTPRYGDFINRVRADWKVNRTVEGSFVWFTPDAVLAMPADGLRDALARQRTVIASLYGGWIDPQRKEKPPFIGFGTAVLRDEFADYRRRIEQAIRHLKDARPGLKVLAYFDAQRDSSPDAPQRFADSLLLDVEDHPERVDWNGKFSPAWGMVPTNDNSFGKAMLDVARAMRGLGADGLYWDEMDGVDFRAPRATLGRSVTHGCAGMGIDAIGRPYALVNLLSEAAKLQYAATGFVLGNVPPTTRAFQTRPDLRMVEAQGDRAPWGPMAHLTTPLAFVGEHGDFATARAKIDEGLLPVTAGFDVAHDMTARLFPFTPEYLQPGTLRGRERIVTTEPGIHGWRRCDGDVRAFRYDAMGREHVADWRVKRLQGGAYARVRIEKGEAAILECGTPH